MFLLLALYNVIRFSNLNDLWVIKIKKPMDLCAGTVHVIHVNFK